jgi:hypothetical protein
MIARVLGGLFALFVLANAAAAAPFPGWQRELQSEAIALYSPPDGEQRRVFFAVSLVEAVNGDVEAWFKNEVAETTSTADLPVNSRSGVKRQGDMLLEALRYVRPEDGLVVDLFLVAYAVGGNKYQLLALAYDTTPPDTDQRVIYALDFIASAYRAKFSLTNLSRFDATAPQVQKVTTVQTQKVTPPPPPPARPSPCRHSRRARTATANRSGACAYRRGVNRPASATTFGSRTTRRSANSAERHDLNASRLPISHVTNSALISRG